MKISIEGIPGSGKTTILKILEQLNYKCYISSSSSTGSAQAFTSADEEATTTERAKIKLIETSPYVLDKLLANLSCNPDEYYPLSKKSSLLMKDWVPDFIIFLDCQPDICMSRLKPRENKRKLPPGLDIPPLLQEIHDTVSAAANDEQTPSPLHITELYLQLDWILHPMNCDIPVYRVNASGSIIHTLHHVLCILNEISDR